MTQQTFGFAPDAPAPVDNSEWYTPGHIIQAARQTLGTIDLDPASCEMAQRTVQATRFYTRQDDGLAHVWKGRIWLNPPYGAGVIDRFADKLLQGLYDGDIEHALVLTNNCTDTAWWHRLANCAQHIVFLRGRLRFYGSLKGSNTPTQGQTIMQLMGVCEEDTPVDKAVRFCDAFEGLGFITRGGGTLGDWEQEAA